MTAAVIAGVLGKLGASSLSPEALEAFQGAAEGWHEFYLLAGTAAVTLVGLLFVALSFHLDTLLHESKAHLLSSAKLTFSNFIYVLVLSLMFLVPGAGPGVLGVWVGVASSVFLVMTLADLVRTRGHGGKPGGLDQFMHRRRILSLVALALALVTGIMLLVAPAPYLLVNFIGPVCLMLGNAAGASWDLLVQVGKIRRAQEIAKP